MAAAMHLNFQCLLGIQCKDFTMIAADQRNTQSSIIVMNDDEDKLYEVSEKVVMGLNGDFGDRTQFSELMAKNIDLYKMKNKYSLGISAITHFARKSMLEALNNKSPYIVNVLVAGFDDVEGGQLYTLDLVAACMKVPFATHGLAGLLSLSILADYYRPDLTEAQAYEVLKLCVSEIHKRLFTFLPSFCVKTISREGIKMLPHISASAPTMTTMTTQGTI